MKTRNWGLCLLAMASIASLSLTTAEGGIFFNRQVVCDECSDCCDDGSVGAPIGAFPGAGLGGRFAGNQQSRRAIPAPVYFANTYPEYLYGSPDIYAGFDEYDTDVTFVSPNVSKTPFHYNYWNDQYQNNQYYGKNWDKNWTIADQAIAEGSVTEVSTQEATQENAGNAKDESSDDAKEVPAAPQSEAGIESTQSEISGMGEYSVSMVERPYQGHFIYNFESFCDDDCQPCHPILNALGAIFGCHHGCCLNGNCGYPLDYADPFVDGTVCDPCFDGIYVDSGIGCDDCGFVGDGFVTDGSCGVDQQATDSADDPEKADAADQKDQGADASQDAKTDAGQDATDKKDNAASSDDTIVAPEQGTKVNDPAVPLPQEDSLPNSDPNEDIFKDLTPAKPKNTNSGVIRMIVPENASVVINGYKTKMTGTDRKFIAKNLIPGETYPFEIRVVLEKNGEILSAVRNVVLTAGDSTAVAVNQNDLSAQGESYALK